MPSEPGVPFNVTVTDTESKLDSFGITVGNATATLNSTSVSGSPSGGTAAVTANLSAFKQGDAVNATASFTRNGTTFTVTRTYTVAFSFQQGPFSFATVIQDFKGSTGDATQTFLVLFLALGLGTAFGRRLGSKGGGLVVLIFLGAGSYTGMVSGYTFLVALLTVIGLIAVRR